MLPEPVAAERFRAGHVQLAFLRDTSGNVAGFCATNSRVWDWRFEKE